MTPSSRAVGVASAVDDDGVVLVIGSGVRLYREYLLAGAAASHPLWLLDAAEPTWQRPYATGTSVVALLDEERLIPDAPRLVATAAGLAGERRIAGVLSYDETLVMATAKIAERLGVPGLSVEGADRCRNKHRSRMILTAAGLPQPRFELAHSLADARAAAAAVGYPVVLKPRGMGASIGVVRVASAVELEAAFAVAERASHGGAPAYEGGVLVEELVEGPEISIDGAVVPGSGYQPFCLARKRIGLAPYFEEVGHTVHAEDPLLRDGELIGILGTAHRALAVDTGITHTEVKLTARGPVIVEVNARIGGDLIPYLGNLATGIDPGHVAVALATGARPPLEPSCSRCVGIRFLYPPHDCDVLAIALPGDAPGLLAARAMVEPGALLRLPPRAHLGRYAYLVCEAGDHDECDERLDVAASLAVLDHRRM